jgi:hypothetical protein
MRAARDPLKSVAVPARPTGRCPSLRPLDRRLEAVRSYECAVQAITDRPVWEMEGVTRYASPRRIRLVAYGARLERGLG